jgi:hemolysin III
VYGFTLVGVFAMSAMYHSISHPRASPWLFRLDQAMIYLLIAGTYTPVALSLVGGPLGWTMFSLQWGLAITGIVLLLAVHRTPQWIHQSAYIVLGWAAVLALPKLLDLHLIAISLLIFGGVAYTGGSALYNRDRKTTWGIGDHGVWHLLVILGAASHCVFMMLYVL